MPAHDQWMGSTPEGNISTICTVYDIPHLYDFYYFTKLTIKFSFVSQIQCMYHAFLCQNLDALLLNPHHVHTKHKKIFPWKHRWYSCWLQTRPGWWKEAEQLTAKVIFWFEHILVVLFMVKYVSICIFVIQSFALSLFKSEKEWNEIGCNPTFRLLPWIVSTQQ